MRPQKPQIIRTVKKALLQKSGNYQPDSKELVRAISDILSPLPIIKTVKDVLK